MSEGRWASCWACFTGRAHTAHVPVSVSVRVPLRASHADLRRGKWIEEPWGVRRPPDEGRQDVRGTPRSLQDLRRDHTECPDDRACHRNCAMGQSPAGSSSHHWTHRPGPVVFRHAAHFQSRAKIKGGFQRASSPQRPLQCCVITLLCWVVVQP